MISTTGPRGGRPLVEAALCLRVRDLRGSWGFYGSHVLTAADGTVISMRPDVGERHGWIGVEHWPAGARWASASYAVSVMSTPQPFGGLRWRFFCPEGFGPCAALYLPAGAAFLASRQAHGLAFRSQRLHAPARAAARARRIRLGLGGEAALDAPFPGRPKGMWAATYERRRAAGLGIEGEAML